MGQILLLGDYPEWIPLTVAMGSPVVTMVAVLDPVCLVGSEIFWGCWVSGSDL